MTLPQHTMSLLPTMPLPLHLPLPHILVPFLIAPLLHPTLHQSPKLNPIMPQPQHPMPLLLQHPMFLSLTMPPLLPLMPHYLKLNLTMPLHPIHHLPQPTMNPNLTMPLNLTMHLHPHLTMPLNLIMHLNLMLLHLQNLHTTNPNLTMPLPPHLAMELLNPVMDPLNLAMDPPNPVMGPHPNVLGANQISPMVQITPTRQNMYPTILPLAMEPLIPTTQPHTMTPIMTPTMDTPRVFVGWTPPAILTYPHLHFLVPPPLSNLECMLMLILVVRYIVSVMMVAAVPRATPFYAQMVPFSTSTNLDAIIFMMWTVLLKPVILT